MRVTKLSRRLSSLCACLLLSLLTVASAHAQQTGSLHGAVLDPSGAAIPDAAITFTGSGHVATTHSGSDGEYSIHGLSAGLYTVTVQAKGFTLAPNTSVNVVAGQFRQLNITLAIEVEQQNVQVTTQTNGVSVNPDENSGALVIKGSDLDALSDDPDQLQNELQALAGPAAGPNGGQIYIDGFSGGQLPPKSSIREIRVNQNPFSAEFDHIGYGRIEILTKPGSDKFGGHITSLATDSSLNTNNALVPNTPPYYLYFLQGDVNGPLTKHSSYFLSVFNLNRQTQAVIDATDPTNTANMIQQFYLTPSSVFSFNPRVDFQLGSANTLSIRDAFNRNSSSGNGVGGLSLQSQASNSINYENALQVSDTIVINSHLINETHFQWRRVRNNQTPIDTSTTQTVQGAFITGGANSGTLSDHQDIFELQNYSTATAGKHTIRFGARLRSYRDANESTSGQNGNCIYQLASQYQPASTAPGSAPCGGSPSQYLVTQIQNPLARALLFDAGLFYQDDWRKTPGLTISYGLRYEAQNRIHDHADFGPRLAIAWAPRYNSKTPPKTVFRVGYGWFYDRFTVPNSFSSATGTPYVIQTIHQNGINQQTSITNYTGGAGAPIPSISTIDSHFRAALSMQGGIGVDHAIGKHTTSNVTYLFTRGVHQYFTDVVTAPSFDISNYTITGPTPTVYNNQFQSGGVFNENQIIATIGSRFKKFSVNANYTYSDAKSDTAGVNSVPSVAQNPGLDYGRASFGITNRIFVLGTYNAPHGIIFAPLLAAQSGTPYNITIGNDLTGNNQFNARPTYGTCGAAGVVTTPYGCLDSDPTGKTEPLVPYNLGTGPANVAFHMRISKAIGIGPRIKTEKGPQGFNGGGGVQGRGLSGSQQQFKLDASVPRRYNLTFIVGALNIFNIANRGTPNGVINSPLFGKTQTLASGPFGLPAPGNRDIFMQALFTF
ncbi:carboxypeptidase regulatory-like domain-containing protein [Granulicella sp. 5B5]|uniref:TonB-dependent receptor n=1 Tax=Granulicella sp. 5B5 TaxID=1617967 RepID=UPI0015F533E7|nr:carboxypeptidase regulatory-like domain-containing protein [Granulicella sp. 5B5]